jgi:hypothetical protein
VVKKFFVVQRSFVVKVLRNRHATYRGRSGNDAEAGASGSALRRPTGTFHRSPRKQGQRPRK